MKTKITLALLITASMLIGCSMQSPLFYDKGVVIKGIRWATRNVDRPGTFAPTPHDPGMFYQWNSNIGWSATDPIVSSDGATIWKTLANSPREWESANDPCPYGWRLPTRAELETLINVDIKWKDGGILLAHKLFMPAAGVRNAGRAPYIPTGGHYWSATRDPKSTTVYSLRFGYRMAGKNSLYIGHEYYRGDALNIRCVKKQMII